MKIIEQIKYGKIRIFIWDNEFEQTCGEIKFNNPENEYIFRPDKIGFDSNQMRKIIKLLDEYNKLNSVKE